MRDRNKTLHHVKVDHTDLDIALYKEREHPPITPTFAMTVDNLSGRAVRWWLEWPGHLLAGATSFGALVRGAREALHLPLDEIARQIVRSDRKTLSVGYLKALERGNRFPSCDLVPQFARVLQIPEDILYFSIGRLPPDLCQQVQPLERIVRACQAFRAELKSGSHPSNETDVPAS